jgi:NAD(P)H-dependent flavin oxidoreductase YrpB (nitropropane dioxygenase family)
MHPTLHTSFCDLLHIEAPILNAGMAGGTAGPALAAAVAEAGGLGGLGGIVGGGPDQLRALISETRDRTSKPFSVNIWAHILGVAPGFLDVCIEERVPSVTFTFGDPAPYVARTKDAGIIVIHQAQTVAGAREAAAAGVDAIIAQGGEAGGHTGSVATMALVPQAVDVAGGIPVIAAGGIADGRGLVAALALGAQGVAMGTRFVAASEATPPAREHRERIIAATADDTVFTDVFDIVDNLRWPAGIHGRSINTEFAQEWHGHEDDLRASLADLRAQADARGELPVRAHSAYAGQSAGLITDTKPAAQIIADIMREAEAVLARLAPRA